MKLNIRLTALVLAMTGSINVSAAPADHTFNYNTSQYTATQAGEYPFSVGVESARVFERELEKNEAEIDEAQDFYARFSYKLEDVPVELYVLAGGMRLEVEQGGRHFDTDYGFAYGAGARSDVWTNDKGTALGIDMRFRRSEPDLDENNFGSRHGDADYMDWEGSVRVSQEINGQVKPYIGIKYDDVRISDVPGFVTQNSDEIIGCFAGADFKMTDELAFNVEATAISEYAAAGSVVWHF